MMTFCLHLKKIVRQNHAQLQFNLKNLKDPKMGATFEAMIGGRFAPLTICCDSDRYAWNDCHL